MPSAVIVTALDKAVQPNAVVALAVYCPSASTLTTSVKPVAPGTTTPLRYQTMVLPAAGLTVAVSVVVINGLSTVTGEAAMVIVGWAFTVTSTLAHIVVLQAPSPLTK